MKYISTLHFINSVTIYYDNVEQKYQHTFDGDDALRCINNAIDNIYLIDNNSLQSDKRLAIWEDFMVTNIKQWYYAYTIVDDIVIIIDACHCNNMSNAAYHLPVRTLSFYQSINLSAATTAPKPVLKSGRSVGCGVSIIYKNDTYHYLVRKGDYSDSKKLPAFQGKYHRIIRDFKSNDKNITPAIGERDNQFYYIDYYSGREKKINDSKIISKYKKLYQEKKNRNKRVYESIMKDIAKVISEHLNHWGK